MTMFFVGGYIHIVQLSYAQAKHSEVCAITGLVYQVHRPSLAIYTARHLT